MKRILAILFVLIMTVSALSACGDNIDRIETNGDGLEFKLNSDLKSYSLVSIGSCQKNNIDITTYKDLPVTVICDRVFYNCTTVKSITIGAGVIKIGDYAFSNCKNLEKVEFEPGSKLTSIGDSSFEECNSLKYITIPSYVTSIGNYVFSGCTELTNVSFYPGIRLTSIAPNMFYNCTSLTNITIPNSVKSIGYYAFSGCTELTDIIIPDSVKSIGYYAFSGCTELTDIIIPDSVMSIEEYAFYGCSNLVSVEIGSNVQNIEKNVFEECYKLVEIANKSSIEIKNQYLQVEDSILEIHNGERKMVEKDGFLFYTHEGINYLLGRLGKENKPTLPKNYNGENYIIYKNAFREDNDIFELTIPSGVTKIEAEAFFGCSNLFYLDFLGQSNLTVISNNAFQSCTSLVSVNIPDSVIDIGERAFSDCGKITNVNMGKNVSTIQYHAFSNCIELTGIVIPSSVKTIEFFAFSGCDNLNNVIFKNKNSWCCWNSMTEIPSTDLEDTAKAATYLKSTYTDQSWHRNEF